MRLGIVIALQLLFEHDLFGKPLHTFPDHALGGNMSRVFGAVCQYGYVVRDIGAAMEHWINLIGVGPWYYIDRVKADYFRHRGVESPIEMSIALANSGDLQIELIQ